MRKSRRKRATSTRKKLPPKDWMPTSAAKGRWPLRTPGWNTITTVLLSVRFGRQLSPQYLVAEPLSEPDALDRAAHLPPRAVPGGTGRRDGSGVRRPAGRVRLSSGVGYKLYVANNNFEGNSRADLRDGKSWGARGQVRFPTGGALRRFDVAADIYRGHVGLTTNELVEDNVMGFESQLEVSSFLFQTEWARGKSLEQTRTGYYLQPALRIDEDWIAFYRVEQLSSPRIRQAERRHMAGLNYRPYPQIAFKGELFRSEPLEREFIHSEEERKPFNGFAAAAVFFF